MSLFLLLSKYKNLLLLPLALSILIIGIIEVSFLKINFKSTPEALSKIWRHRGGLPVNSIVGVRKAIQRDGFQGVEIDLFYSEKKNVFYVTHDLPGESSEFPTLESFLLELKDLDSYLWLDLKNLDNNNVSKIKEKLLSLTKKHPSFSQFLIESSEYLPIRELSYSGFNTIYWINPHANSRILYFRSLVNKLKLLFSDFVGVSVYHTQYEISIEREDLLKEIPLYIFTINDKKRIKKYSKVNNIKVLLTGNKSIKPSVVHD